MIKKATRGWSACSSRCIGDSTWWHAVSIACTAARCRSFPIAPPAVVSDDSNSPMEQAAALDEVPAGDAGRGGDGHGEQHPGDGSVVARFEKGDPESDPEERIDEGPAHAQTVCRDEEDENPAPAARPRAEISDV